MTWNLKVVSELARQGAKGGAGGEMGISYVLASRPTTLPVISGTLSHASSYNEFVYDDRAAQANGETMKSQFPVSHLPLLSCSWNFVACQRQIFCAYLSP